MSKDII